MLGAIVVTVVIDGTAIGGIAEARLVGGHVMAPLDPVVIRLATRVVYEPLTSTVLVVRGRRRVVVPVVYAAGTSAYVALAPILRAIGATSDFDSATKTISIQLAAQNPLVTPLPLEASGAPAAQPVVTPPLAPTPRTIETGVPRPRRTAIPVRPSQPAGTPPRPER